MAEIKRLTRAELAEIRHRQSFVVDGANWESWIAHDIIEDDVPALVAEVERLRSNLKTIALMSGCANTQAFAKSAIDGTATIEIRGERGL